MSAMLGVIDPSLVGTSTMVVLSEDIGACVGPTS
jgi:hypothetical protein